MKGFVRIQVAPGRGKYPDPKTGSHDGKCKEVEVMEKPALEESGGGNWITLYDFGRKAVTCLFLRMDYATCIHLPASAFSPGSLPAEAISEY